MNAFLRSDDGVAPYRDISLNNSVLYRYSLLLVILSGAKDLLCLRKKHIIFNSALVSSPRGAGTKSLRKKSFLRVPASLCPIAMVLFPLFIVL